MDYRAFFAGKRVTLMGLGLLGRGVGDAAFVAPLCKELTVTDLKSPEALAGSVAQLHAYPNVRFVLGEHRESDFTNTDMVIKAAGVPLDSPYVAAARAAQVPVYMSTALFAKFAREAGAALVGVTGTRGKSTTAALIYHTLVAAGRRAHLGGNVRGVSTLAMLPEVVRGDLVVLELDSWQLQGFGDLALSPDVAVFTNLMPDHLNYYRGDMDAYFADKANIFRSQRAGDTLVSDPMLHSRIAPMLPAGVRHLEPAGPVPAGWCPNLVGAHNQVNAALAAAALGALGLSDGEVRAGFATFMPVEGRLQLLREVNGVRVYNDNNATTPEATCAALRAFDPARTVLIAGGADKQVPLDALAAEAQKCKKVLLLAGTGTDKLAPSLPNATVYRSIADAVHDAMAAAKAGDVVLFSPGFASFGLFTNEYDRNDQFVARVAAL